MGLWGRITGVLLGRERSNAPGVASDQAKGVCSSGRLPVSADAEPPHRADSRPDESDSAPWYAPQGATLLAPAPVEPPELSHEARVLENMLVSQFEGSDLTLPPLPLVPQDVLRLTADPDCSLDEIAGKVSEDQVIAAAVLRAANSPLYYCPNKATTLEKAVVRLGVNPLRVIMMHQTLRAATFVKGKGDLDFAAILWRRSLAGACIMRALSKFMDLDYEEAFVMGLLHDVGNVMVLRVVSNQETFTRSTIDLATFEYLCYECHQEFGELIADAWNLPPRIKELVRDHHNYPADADPLRTERLQLLLTDMINQQLGYGPPASYNLLESRPVRDLALDKSGRKFVEFLARLPEEIEDTMTYL
jgi:HD-like signal output (HDOD) protein